MTGVVIVKLNYSRHSRHAIIYVVPICEFFTFSFVIVILIDFVLVEKIPIILS